jgi:sulfur-oxidizing protein SoxZ
VAAGDNMSTIRIRSKRKNGHTQIRTLIVHPMETGRNKDKKTGVLIPANFIQQLTVKVNDKVVASLNTGASISKNPYFAFQIKGGYPGDVINISWLDNLGNSDTAESVIK